MERMSAVVFKIARIEEGSYRIVTSFKQSRFVCLGLPVRERKNAGIRSI